jgi:cell division protein ZapB
MNAFTSTNGSHSKQAGLQRSDAYNSPPCFRRSAMSRIEELAERVERLLLRHDEVQRTNALLREQLASVTHERDNLRSRLNAARSRIDVLLDRLPREIEAPAAIDGAAVPQAAADDDQLRRVG